MTKAKAKEETKVEKVEKVEKSEKRERKRGSLMERLLVAFAGTTLSIILTFGTTGLINHINRNKDRRLTALMVMSSIESFARNLEDRAEEWNRMDSIATWLLRLPIDQVSKLGEGPFDDAIAEVFETPIMSHDKTAETIFSSNIDTWKNMGNFQFIDNVGACFSYMNFIEQELNDEAIEYAQKPAQVVNNPSSYPGKTITEKLLRDEQVRRQLLQPNSIKAWLAYCADYIRQMNRSNMKLIDIPEEEVMAFTDALADIAEEDDLELDISDYKQPHPDADSVNANLLYARQLDSLLNRSK